MTDPDSRVEIEVSSGGEQSTITVPMGEDVSVTVTDDTPEDSEGGEDGADAEPEPGNPFHGLGTVMGLAALISAVSAPFTSVGFKIQAGFALALFILGAGLHAVGDIREYGEIPDPWEQEYSVPEDPTELLDGEDGDEDG